MNPASPADADEPLLAGLTVLDFTRVLAGPYCTRLLADLGARVIKVERPGEGDEVRYTVKQLEPERTDQSSYFVRLNVGKRGIAIDLAHPLAHQVVLDLVRVADVVVENFSPGVMARYGLDAAALQAVRPDLVYCSISGFGQTGPLSSMQAYAHLINAVSGVMDLERGADTEPRVAYLQAADVLAGAHAFGSVCAALVRRARTGRGAYLDVSMLECLVCADDITYTAALNGAAVERRPRVGMLVHPIGGRHIAMQTAGAPHLWPRLAGLMGRPELTSDPRFSTPAARRANWAAVLEHRAGLARQLRERRSGRCGAVWRARPLRPHVVPGGSDRTPAPGGAIGFPRGRSSRRGQSARHRDAVSRRWPADRARRPGALSGRRAHA